MKRLLLSSALVAALAGQMALAQTTGTDATGTETTGMMARPTITPPEGYAMESTSLTAEQLLGATIYEAGGDAVGEVQDLVFAPATDGPAMGTTTGTAADTTADTATGTTGDATTEGTTGTEGVATDGTGTDATATDTTTMSGAEGAAITHAILDVGGFLGIGERRVAVPMEDLMIYANGSDVRVYLPWTQEQLEAQVAYDPNDASTLGRPMYAPVN